MLTKRLTLGSVLFSATSAFVFTNTTPAAAVIYNINGTDYDITTVTGNLTDLMPQLEQTSWWDTTTFSSDLAQQLALASKGDFGYPNSFPSANSEFGPIFVSGGSSFDPGNLMSARGSAWGRAISNPFNTFTISGPVDSFGLVDSSSVATFAIGNAVPVPLETDAFPFVFSGLFLAGGIWFKRKRSQAKVSEFIANKG